MILPWPCLTMTVAEIVDRVHVDVDDLLPSGIGEIQEVAENTHAGVVDQNIDLAVSIQAALHHGFPVLLICQPGQLAKGAAAGPSGLFPFSDAGCAVRTQAA